MKWYLQLHYLKSSWYGFLINLGRGDKSLFMIKLAHFSYSLPRLFTARAARFINQSNLAEQNKQLLGPGADHRHRHNILTD